MLFQVFSRPNDRNGNPYRLVLVYNAAGEIIEAYETRNSSPNIVGNLRRRYAELPTVHVAPAEYRNLRSAAQLSAILTPES